MIRFFIFGIGLLINMAAYCQQHKFEKVDVQSAILNNSVADLLLDKSGFLWVASTEGLGRYDGHNVVEFKHSKNIKNSICSSKVNSICEGPDGKIWIATMAGLSVYDPVSEETRCLFYEAKDITRSDNIILWVLVDQKGFVWHSSYNGLYRFDPKTEDRKVFLPDDNNPNSISNGLVFSIFEDKEGTLWFANRNGISYYKNDDSFKFVNFFPDPSNPFGLQHERFFTFCQTSNGDLWLGGDTGFYKVDKSDGQLRFINYKYNDKDPNSLSYDFVNHLLANGNDLWASTWAGGLNKVVFEDQDVDFTHYRSDANDPHSLITDEVTTTLIDNSGVLWVGTGFGLMKSSLSKSKFGLIQSKPNVNNSLTNNKVHSTLVDSEGNLWVGTDSGLNFRPAKYTNDESYFINFKHRPGDKTSLTHNNIFDIYEDSSKRIWIATYDGFSIADLNTFEESGRFKNFKFNQKPHKWVYNILETAKDEFWVSTYGKLAKMRFPVGAEEPDLEIFDMDPSNPKALSNATTYQACKDAKGRIWVASFYGLNLVNEEDGQITFTSYYKDRNDSESLSDVYINCLFLDRRGSFWVGTNNGLNLVIEDQDGNISFRTFDESNGLPNSRINFIEEDFQGFLWIGTGNGVVQFDPKKIEQADTPVMKIYTHHDGLGQIISMPRTSCSDKAGNIYFGSEGLNYFNPKNLILNHTIPDLVFTKLKVRNEEVRPKESKILNSSISIAGSEVNLKHDDNTIEIFFSCLEYSNPKKNRYKYKMEGINNDWVKSGNQNWASYTNLTAGEYTFQVMGCNNDGIWNNEPISLTVNVAPHWAKSKLAYTLYLLLGAGLFGLFYRWRNVRAKEKIKMIKDIEIARLEEREILRKKNAADFHDELGHRLTKIALFLEVARKQVNGNEKLVEYLEKVKINTKSLSDGLKDLIWSLDPKKDTMLDTINRIQEVGDALFDYSEMKFSTHAIDPHYGSMKLSPAVRKHILLIFKEAMNNTLKYSNADQCKFQSDIKEERAYFIFKDNGVGFDEETISNGNGLRNMRERAEKIGGELELETSKNNGTKISISIPITDKVPIIN